jgi:predicted P-loop ATPase
MEPSHEQKRDLVRIQSGILENSRIDEALEACGGDEVLATLQLMNKSPVEIKKPYSVWDTVRQICDDKDAEMQKQLQEQKN